MGIKLSDFIKDPYNVFTQEEAEMIYLAAGYADGVCISNGRILSANRNRKKSIGGVKMKLPKYRAWDYNYKKMWKVVAMSEPTYDDCEEPFIKVCEFDKSPRHKETDIRFSFNFDLMQFTGLYDKHHKPIYEGDIVESLTKINGYVCRGVVIFENGKFMVDVKKAAFARDGFISDFDLKIREYEVIGNIYENPELLEGVTE